MHGGLFVRAHRGGARLTSKEKTEKSELAETAVDVETRVAYLERVIAALRLRFPGLPVDEAPQESDPAEE